MQYRLGDNEMSGVMLGDLYRAQMDSLTAELAQFQREELAGLKVRRVVLDGDPAVRIVEFAHQEKVDLIMMPTHGCGMFRRFILGSNTAKVLHDAECPVWTGVHIAEAATRPVEVRHVLCAVDLGAQSERALKWADWLSRGCQAKLTLLHVTAAVPETADHTEDAWRATCAGRRKKRWAACRPRSARKPKSCSRRATPPTPSAPPPPVSTPAPWSSRAAPPPEASAACAPTPTPSSANRRAPW